MQFASHDFHFTRTLEDEEEDIGSSREKPSSSGDHTEKQTADNENESSEEDDIFHAPRPRLRRSIVSAGKVIQSDDDTGDDDSGSSDDDNDENNDNHKNKDTDEDIDIDASQREGVEAGRDEDEAADNTSDDEGVPRKTPSRSRRLRKRNLKPFEDDTKKTQQPAKRTKKRGVDIKEATGDERVRQRKSL